MPTLSNIEAEAVIPSGYSSAQDGAVSDLSFLRRLSVAAVALGCLLRLAEYLLDRSLWMDEAYLALNILHRPFAGLFQPLDYHQGAPTGFLLLQKSAVLLAGTSEYALRLIPLLAGVASVFLFYKLATKTLLPNAVAIAIGLFAISPSLIYYSSEVKQYSIDVAVALVLYCLTIEGSRSEWKAWRVIATAFAGAAAIWISHASIFVLAGSGATLSITTLVRKDWVRLRRVSIICLVWAMSLAACYLVALRRLAADRELLDYWKDSFMPLPPHSLTDFKWFVDSFFGFFNTSAGLKFIGLAALVSIIGGISIFRKSTERGFLLVAPAIFTLVASGLHKYPFGGRLTLFLVPAALLLMAEGAELLRASTPRSVPAGGAVLLALLFVDPGMYVLHHFARPHTEVAQPGIMFPEELKPVVTYVQGHESPGDLVYVFYGSQPAFEYYAERDHFIRDNVEIGSASGDDPHGYESDLNPLRGHRAWVILSHTHGVGAGESRHIFFYLDTLGPRLECFTRAGAEACLYDLRAAIATTH